MNIANVTYGGMLAPPAPPAPTREQIVRLQEAMWPVRSAMPEALHHFAAGMYLRELSIPAGLCIVGKTHRHEHFVMLVKGDASIASEQGVQRVQAPWFAVSPPGIKRVVVAHTDCTFLTVHLNPSDTQDVAQIETEHIEPEALPGELPHAATGELQ